MLSHFKNDNLLIKDGFKIYSFTIIHKIKIVSRFCSC